MRAVRCFSPSPRLVVTYRLICVPSAHTKHLLEDYAIKTRVPMVSAPCRESRATRARVGLPRCPRPPACPRFVARSLGNPCEALTSACTPLRPCFQAPQHSALFDLPVRFVVGTGILSGAIWTMTRPSDKPLVLAAEAETGKKKALVRTASGAVRAGRRHPPPCPIAYHQAS